jgi:DNA-binding transcriptional regulator YdaS (Cro superfamily)
MVKKTDTLQRIFEAVGGPAALAKELGVTKQAISQWRKVPPRRALEIQRLTGIPCHEMRPDLFPNPGGA